MEAAFAEYSKLILKTKERKPSLLEKLQKYKAVAKAAPVKNKSRGEIEL